MASLYLIRHGQASFGEPEYDRLSPKGHQQGIMLGQSWQTMPFPDLVFTGELLRHHQTYEAFNQASKVQLPTNEISALNEFDHVDILMQSQKYWQSYQDLVEYFSNLPNAMSNLKQVVDDALVKWANAGECSAYQESWPAFKSRAISALTQMIAARQAEHRHILAFTSGGIIAAIIQHLLSLSDPHCLQLMRQIRNTSVTKIQFSGDRVSLDYFNNYQHLEQVGASWSTHR
ncbi:histidine phosphatase family protein [Thalassotalea euphylliae]|uniref:Histidine phosphatase family protein n=1 Tax=Thalassotalea euphylliae TaxID=1655234 RepID=A0A3E0TRF1_9GAMM|nr:histidine phosphatase family protein [Thalassotalea euphylliae]REL26940.1 histidine phosphatase family protein [Thalassotalea euphylliae]